MKEEAVYVVVLTENDSHFVAAFTTYYEAKQFVAENTLLGTKATLHAVFVKSAAEALWVKKKKDSRQTIHYWGTCADCAKREWVSDLNGHALCEHCLKRRLKQLNQYLEREQPITQETVLTQSVVNELQLANQELRAEIARLRDPQRRDG